MPNLHLSLKVGLFLDPFQFFAFRLMQAFVIRLVTTAHPSSTLTSPATGQNVFQIQLQTPCA